MAFYAQHHWESLHLELTIIQALQAHNSIREESTEQEFPTITATFLFPKDDVFKKIDVFSGGEKVQVDLVTVLLSQTNFLLLNEPTNHIDNHYIDILGSHCSSMRNLDCLYHTTVNLFTGRQ